MLSINNLTKIFNKGDVTEHYALSDINLTVSEGDFVTIIGGNGAGKSTLLNVVSGVHTCDTGSIILDGKDITILPEYKRAAFIGRVFQNPMVGTAGGMNIQENLALAYRRGQKRGLKWGITTKERELFHEELSKLGLGLETMMEQKVSTLSGGQRQSLALLMAVLCKPKLLLLDEHTAALDPKTAKKIMGLTNEIAQTGVTALMVTHNMTDAIKTGNRLIMMNEGKIIYDCSGKEKENLQVIDLMKKFESCGAEMDDRLLLNRTEQ